MSIPPRTTAAQVQKVLVNDYDGTTDLTPYIELASDIVDQVLVIAASRSQALSVVTAEIVERWLSAHYYTKMDPTYASKSTGGASASFVRGSAEPEPYKDAAINADTSGALNAILKRLVARGFWGGKKCEERSGTGC